MKITLFLIALVFSLHVFSQNSDKKNKKQATSFPHCDDMSGENGWNNWQGTVGTSNPLTFPNPLATPVAPNFILTNGLGMDSCTPGITLGDPTIPFVAPGFGIASLQIGEPHIAGCKAEKLRYNIPVSLPDSSITLAYAVVFSDGGHPKNQQPFVKVTVLDAVGGTISGSFTDTLSANSPGVYQSSCTGLYYKPWTTRCLHLIPYTGMNVSVEIINSDCSAPDCNHFTYSYWDFKCGCNIATDINEKSNAISFAILPSVSATGLFSIENYFQAESISIYNSFGEKILKELNPFKNSSIYRADLSARPSGIYFVSLQTDYGTVTKKIVIAK